MSTARGTNVILGAITPSVRTIDADELAYPHLKNVLNSYSLPDILLSGNFFSRKNYSKKTRAKEELKIAYLLTAAYRLQKAWAPPTKLFWSNQFTLTSVQLFGRPLNGEVSKLAHDELRYFEHFAEQYPGKADFFEPVLRAYDSLVTQRVEIHPSLEVRYRDLLSEVRRLFCSRYSKVLGVFDDIAPNSQLKSDTVAEKFTVALDILQQSDSSWEHWRIVRDNSAKLCVNPDRRIITVGRRRAPIPAEEIKGLFAHELLVHAKRSIEGRKRTSELAHGLPGYTAAEEGLGVLVESAINGHFSPKVKDRYIDIALALGDSRRAPLTRMELYTFCYSRNVIRSIDNGEETSLDMIEKTTWEHVNRIYRGSLGNKYVGVFTKDVSYYKGFVRIAKYLERRRAKVGLDQAVDYLMQGKFDPTLKQHRDRVKIVKK